MNKLIFCITTVDQTVINRWQDAFKKEGWEAEVFNCLGTLCAGACRAELDLVEVGSPLCGTPEELQKVIKNRKPVATLAFATRKNISDAQIVKFLGAGADDFILADMDERVLVAKIKTYMRRLEPAIAAALAKVESNSGDIKIDRARRVVSIRTGPGECAELLHLTQKELEILSMLVGSEKRVVSRRRMLEEIWGGNAAEVYPHCISKHLETLRKKLGPHGRRIKTVYGSGYMFT